jgi:hypothetical protein
MRTRGTRMRHHPAPTAEPYETVDRRRCPPPVAAFHRGQSRMRLRWSMTACRYRGAVVAPGCLPDYGRAVRHLAVPAQRGKRSFHRLCGRVHALCRDKTGEVERYAQACPGQADRHAHPRALIRSARSRSSPCGQALGVTYQAPEAGRYGYCETCLRGRITGALGGRAAEEIIYSDVTTGAGNDMEHASNSPGRWRASGACPRLSDPSRCSRRPARNHPPARTAPPPP